MLDLNCCIRKGVKIKFGYKNAALYDMINRRVFLVNTKTASDLLNNQFDNISASLLKK